MEGIYHGENKTYLTADNRRQIAKKTGLSETQVCLSKISAEFFANPYRNNVSLLNISFRVIRDLKMSICIGGKFIYFLNGKF